MIALGIAGGPETRDSYTGIITRHLDLLAAGGGTRRSAWLSSAVAEIAAGWWSRVLSLAVVEPDTPATRAITPSVLSCCGRRLARDGEVVFVLTVVNGALRLLEASQCDVDGGADPESWRYRACLAGPSQTETLTLPAAGVVHARYGWYTHRPWQGVSPADFAAGGSGLVGGLDTMLSGEALSPSAYVLEIPEVGETPDGSDPAIPDPTAKLRADLAAAQGGTATMAALRGSDPLSDPRQVAPFRIGMNPPDELRWFQSEAGGRMLAAYGLHPSMTAANVNGQIAREAWRVFLALTAQPLARLLEAEFSRALEVPVTLNLAAARAADTGTLARAVGVLVKGGMDLQAALDTVGLGEASTP